MPTTDQLRAKLIEKLEELFQLDQPELDFGFYRIMHAKAEQVQRFLENDLLAEVQQAFADGNSGKQAELKAAYEQLLQQAMGLGAPDPENAPAVQEAKGRWEAALDTTKAEAEVYDHLYRFFERYYEDGDFVSRRYLTRETAGKAAPYAVPYDGQEVMLHWANRDQYYIKTSEHFDNYTFEAREAARQVREEAKKNKDQGALELGEDLLQGDPLRVHFRIVDAAEGEHNNVKTTSEQKRQFLPFISKPAELNAKGELQLNFEYRPLPGGYRFDEDLIKRTYAIGNKGDLPPNWMAHVFLEAISELDLSGPYTELLSTDAPTPTQKKRTLLAKYIDKYTATNSKDYFIHKDLGGFLRRELDFYLKNEVMRLDDLDGAEAPRVEHYLAKLKVIRRIAHKLIDFLAQLENFQKRLWLKKKFVVETNWCITLDRVPEALYPALAANPRIKAEWEQLFHIQDLPGYEAKKPLTVAFLKANPYLVLDTAFLSEADKAALLNSIDDLEGQTNGLLVHSENFQALRLLEGMQRSQVDLVAIDPPYNTGGDDFLYKDDFLNASWLCMLENRTVLGELMLKDTGTLFVNIGDKNHEHHGSPLLVTLLDQVLRARYVGQLVWQTAKGGGNAKTFVRGHEYVLCYSNNDDLNLTRSGEKGDNHKKAFEGGSDKYVKRGGRVYWLNDDVVRKEFGKYEKGVERRCLYEEIEQYKGAEKKLEIDRLIDAGEYTLKPNPNGSGHYICRLEDIEGMRMSLYSILQGHLSEKGRTEVEDMGLTLAADIFPKPIGLMKMLLDTTDESEANILDFFAGSGSTGHAVVEMNREAGNRRFSLIEMSDYFDTITKPRLQKSVYSRAWSEGKPVDRDGISHCFKYIRLESYEDTLNALELRSDAEREKLLAANKALREDYTLRYLLDVETQGSASLLNHAAFTDPRAYTLNVKRPGSEERTTKTVDLLETFNYLLGLRVQHMAAPEAFTATFERVQEKDVPKDSPQRLVVKGNLKPVAERGTSSGAETWWFRKVQGWMPRDRHKPHGERDKVLIIWRTLTGDLEQDNAVLDTYFTKNRVEIRDREYDVIYVNGSNNLPNLLQAGDRWKVRLIEEDFHRLMWEGVE